MESEDSHFFYCAVCVPQNRHVNNTKSVRNSPVQWIFVIEALIAIIMSEFRRPGGWLSIAENLTMDVENQPKKTQERCQGFGDACVSCSSGEKGWDMSRAK